jgi:hypothetical protein
MNTNPEYAEFVKAANPAPSKSGASKFQNRCEKPRKQGQESGWYPQPDCLNLWTGFIGLTAKPLETGYSEASAT